MMPSGKIIKQCLQGESGELRLLRCGQFTLPVEEPLEGWTMVLSLLGQGGPGPAVCPFGSPA